MGLSAKRIRTLRSSGRWVTVLGDVLAPAGTPLTHSRRLQAAVLATGGVLSHGTAATIWGWRAPEDEDIHVTVARTDHPRVSGVRLHRRRLVVGDRSWTTGFEVTSRARTLTDCLLTWQLRDAADLMDYVLRTGAFALADLDRLVAAARGLHGINQLVGVVEQSRGGSWSAAERRLHGVLNGAGIAGWVANHAIELPTGRRAVVDVWFPEARLAVEVDGQAWHVDRERFQTDRSRQNALILSGLAVLRFTWHDIQNAPDRVVREIKMALRAAAS
jgi:very-short-patch-repair endonuclease